MAPILISLTVQISRLRLSRTDAAHSRSQRSRFADNRSYTGEFNVYGRVLRSKNQKLFKETGDDTMSRAAWFYEEDGQRRGAVSEEEIIALIQAKKLVETTRVWQQGFPDWIELKSTPLNTHLPGDWFYEKNGHRHGGVSEEQIVALIRSGTLDADSRVWQQGFPDWIELQSSALKIHLPSHDPSAPPPLPASAINNTIVWILAFAPWIGFELERQLALSMHADEVDAAYAFYNNDYFFVTLGLNILLSVMDEKKLSEAGYNTDKFKGWVWFVPVYLFQRAKVTGQTPAYFWVWIAMFVLTMW